MNLTFADPTEWWLEIWPTLQADDWQASQSLATPTRRHNFFLNQLCLHSLLPWLQAEYFPDVAAWPDMTALHSIWEVVGGVGLTIAAKRLVLLPTETLDSNELEVPQEWVDIPNWAADYYLAIQINLEDPWLRVWGYTTHQQLKLNATFDPSDRTYCLSGQALIRDLNTFWNTFQFCPQAVTQASIPPLPALSPAQADTLIRQLSLPAILFPRLALPFQQWAALLNQPDWRQQLYQNRLSTLQSQPHASTIPSLKSWLQPPLTAGWQSLETFLGTHPQVLAPGLRAIAISSGDNEQRVKRIELGAQSNPQAVILLLALNPQLDGRVGVQVQIHPSRGQANLPPNLTLAIYSSTDQLLQSIQSRLQDDYIQLPLFKCPPGTHFRLQVSLDDDRFSEHFAV